MNTTESLSTFRRRRLAGRLKAWRPVIVTVGALAVLGFGGWVVLFSSWLTAQDVSVAGETTLSVHDVEAAAGVTLGTPMVRVDLGAVQDRVASLPAVRSVAVHRSWPHTISIEITERRPIATIRRAGQWWVLDDQGVVFRKTGKREAGLPVIAVPRTAGSDAVPEAASVISVLPSGLLTQTKRLTAQSMDSITLRLKDKSAVVWGSSAESDRKVKVLRALLSAAKARVYDVSVPELPTTSG